MPVAVDPVPSNSTQQDSNSIPEPSNPTVENIESGLAEEFFDGIDIDIGVSSSLSDEENTDGTMVDFLADTERHPNAAPKLLSPLYSSDYCANARGSGYSRSHTIYGNYGTTNAVEDSLIIGNNLVTHNRGNEPTFLTSNRSVGHYLCQL